MTWANKASFFLICTIVVFTALAYGTVHQPVIAVFYVMVATLAVLWAADAYISGTVRFSRSLLQLPLLAAALYAFIQVIPLGTLGETGGVLGITRTISADPFATQVAALHFLALLLFLASLLVCLESAARLRRLTVVITVFGFAYAFFAILQSVLSPDKIYGIYETQFASPFGSFVNRHNFAAYMEMAISVPLGLIFVGAVTKDKRLLYITAIALMGIALLLSGSRGGLVALLAEIIVLIMLTSGGTRKNVLVKAALALALVGAVIAGAFFVGGDTSLTRLTETAGTKDITTNRTHIWSVTLQVIANNLPFGAGIGAFGAAYTPFDSFNGLERVEQAHNDYLQVLADAGIVGAIIGAAFLFWLIRDGIRNSKTDNLYRRGIAVGAFAGIAAILVHSVFDFVLHTTAVSIMFLVLVGMLASSSRKFEDDRETQHPQRYKPRRSGSISSISEAKRRTSLN